MLGQPERVKQQWNLITKAKKPENLLTLPRAETALRSTCPGLSHGLKHQHRAYLGKTSSELPACFWPSPQTPCKQELISNYHMSHPCLFCLFVCFFKLSPAQPQVLLHLWSQLAPERWSSLCPRCSVLPSVPSMGLAFPVCILVSPQPLQQ